MRFLRANMNGGKEMNRFQRNFYRAAYVLYAGAVMCMADILPAYADTTAKDVTNKVTKPINTLVSILTTCLAAAGSLILIKAVLELINAIQQQDNSGIFHAGRSIVVALLMIAIKPLITLLT